MEEAQQRSERRHSHLCRAATLISAAGHHKGDYVGRGQMPEIQGAIIRQDSAMEKGAHGVDVAAGGRMRQTSLNHQIVPVSLQHLFHRTAGGGRWWCWRYSEIAQVSEHGPHRPERKQLRVTGGTTGT